MASTVRTWIWSGAALASLALAGIAAVALCHPPLWPAVLLGWAVALANAVVACALNRKAVGAGREAFLRWGVFGNCLRLALLLCILLDVIFAHKAVRGSFVVSVFTGIFVFLPAEIAELFRSQNEPKRTH